MFKFKYHDTLTFDIPGPNQPKGCVTTYYKSIKSEYLRLRHYVAKVDIQLEQAKSLDPDIFNSLRDPIREKRWRKTNGTYYSPYEVVRDLNNQLDKGRDPTESMINRWNDVMDKLGISSECGIELIYTGTK